MSSPSDRPRTSTGISSASTAHATAGKRAGVVLNPATPTFSDVPANHWSYAYVETAVLHGALAGYADGTFRPNANVTRAQLAKIGMTEVARRRLGWRLMAPLVTATKPQRRS